MSTKRAYTLAGFISLGIALSCHAIQYDTLDYPDAPGADTYLTGIRDNNIVGLSESAGVTTGLRYQRAQEQWTVLNFPDATSTAPYGPGKGADGSNTFRMVGSYKASGSNNDIGFLYDETKVTAEKWKTLQVSGANNTIAHSMYGDRVVGNYDASGIAGRGFLYSIESETFTDIVYPHGVVLTTTAYGIWDDHIAGGYKDGAGVEHGYIYDLTNDEWTSYDHPEGIISHFDGITGGNEIGEFYLTGDWIAGDLKEYAFGYSTESDSFLDILFPGSEVTSGNSIYENNIIGVYTVDGESIVHGYIASQVPEPGDSALLIGAFGLVFLLYRKRGCVHALLKKA